MSRQKYSKAIAYTVFVSLKKIVYREAALHEVGKLQKNSKKILTKSRFLHNWAEFQKKIDPIQNCISERSTFVDLTLLCMFLWSGMIIRSRAWKSCSEKICFQKKVSKKNRGNSYSEENPFWKVLLEAIGSFFITYLQPHYGNEFFWQCLPFSWTTLRGKHCRHPINMTSE